MKKRTLYQQMRRAKWSDKPEQILVAKRFTNPSRVRLLSLSSTMPIRVTT